MKKIYDFFRTEKKENPVGMSLVPMGKREVGGAKEGRELYKDGYSRNVIVYRAISLIAKGASSLKLDLFRDETIVEKHPIIDLLRRPNPLNGQASFLEELFTFYMLTGEMWIVKNGTLSSSIPRELWTLNPLEMAVEPGMGGIAKAYIHKRNNIEKRFEVDPITGKSDVFFLKMVDPLEYWRGMPPIRAAALAADAHNEGLNWNYNLMRKGARPSGWVKAGSNPGAEVIARLKEWYQRTIQGSDNAGDVLIAWGGAEYVPFEQNAKDMDFIAGMKEYAKYVSSAFGVPLPLIDNDAASMNNMEQAKEMLYTDTIIPHVNRFLDSFNAWLAHWYGEGYRLVVDEDQIAALEGLRQKRFDRTVKAVQSGLISINEGRGSIGWDAYEESAAKTNADKLYINGGLIPLDMSDVGYDPSEADKPEDSEDDTTT